MNLEHETEVFYILWCPAEKGFITPAGSLTQVIAEAKRFSSEQNAWVMALPGEIVYRVRARLNLESL